MRSRVVFCPIDVYGGGTEIDGDSERLNLCHRVVVHCDRLARYFRGYRTVQCVEHHVKYLAPIANDRPPDGPILWVGERSNLPPFVEWVNQHSLLADLLVLTNLESNELLDWSRYFGFHTDRQNVKVENWSAKRHREWLPKCRAAIDIKGTDFRARHKPAAKACDFIASGIPLAIQAESSSAEFLHRRGFNVATPDSPRWLSPEYLEETIEFGRTLRQVHSLENITRQWAKLLHEVAQEPIGRRRLVD